MTTLQISPIVPHVDLTMSPIDAPEVGLEVNVSPEPQMVLEVGIGVPGPAADLTPVLDALNDLQAAQKVDIEAGTNAVLAAIAAVPTSDVTEAVAPLAKSSEVAAGTEAVLAAVAAIPAPDVSASLESYNAAQKTDITAGTNAVLAAIAAVPTSDVAEAVAPLAKSSEVAVGTEAVLAAVAAIPAPDVSASLEGYNAAQKSDITAGTNAVLAAIAAVPTSDVAEAVAPLAKSSEVAAGTQAVLAAIDGARAYPGEIRQFQKGQVPPTFEEFSDSVVLPANGSIYSLGIGLSGYGAGVYVSEGTAKGPWRLSGGAWQRWDFDSNQAVGPRYTVTPARGNTNFPFAVAIGKFIYYGGGYSTVNLVDFFCLNTETGQTDRLTSLPRGINYASAAVVDKRICIWAAQITGITQTAGSTYFWLYDPATNLTPVEVVVSLPLLNAHSTIGHGMARLPSGNSILILETTDGAASATQHTTRYSCVLTVSGNTIAVGPAENSGYAVGAVAAHLLETPAGAHLFSSGSVVKTYLEGVGWVDGAQTFAHKPTVQFGTAQSYASVIPSLGWYIVDNYANFSYGYMLLTSKNAPGSPTIYARKKVTS